METRRTTNPRHLAYEGNDDRDSPRARLEGGLLYPSARAAAGAAVAARGHRVARPGDAIALNDPVAPTVNHT